MFYTSFESLSTSSSECVADQGLIGPGLTKYTGIWPGAGNQTSWSVYNFHNFDISFFKNLKFGMVNWWKHSLTPSC